MKMLDARLYRSLLTVSLLLAAPLLGTAQTPAAATSTPMPTDPAALLQLAAQKNGLAGKNLKPWHIKVAYQTYDDKGQPTPQGTIEEWWAAPEKYKIIIQSPTSQTILYRSPRGVYLGGDKVVNTDAFTALRWMVAPIPGRDVWTSGKLKRKMKKIGSARFDCVTIQQGRQPQEKDPPEEMYCFESDRPVLRIVAASPVLNVMYQKIAALGNRYMGDKIEFIEGSSLLESAQLISGGFMPHMSSGLTAMPPEATGHTFPFKHYFDSGAVVHAGKKIGGENPQYPWMAKTNHVQGVVILLATIGTDGKIHDLRVASSSSPLLTGAALKAVRTWRYTPYTLGGAPVKVLTRINVVFHLGQIP